MMEIGFCWLTNFILTYSHISPIAVAYQKKEGALQTEDTPSFIFIGKDYL